RSARGFEGGLPVRRGLGFAVKQGHPLAATQKLGAQALRERERLARSACGQQPYALGQYGCLCCALAPTGAREEDERPGAYPRHVVDERLRRESGEREGIAPLFAREPVPVGGGVE